MSLPWVSWCYCYGLGSTDTDCSLKVTSVGIGDSWGWRKPCFSEIWAQRRYIFEILSENNAFPPVTSVCESAISKCCFKITVCPHMFLVWMFMCPHVEISDLHYCDNWGTVLAYPCHMKLMYCIQHGVNDEMVHTDFSSEALWSALIEMVSCLVSDASRTVEITSRTNMFVPSLATNT